MKGKLYYCEFIQHNSNSQQPAVKTQWQTSFVMLPWRRASICNRDNSWGMKALRRGRVTSGIQTTDNGNQSKSNFLSCYQPESLPKKQKAKQTKQNSNPNNIPFRNKTTVVTRKPGKTHTFTFTYMHKSQVCVSVSWTIWIQAMSDPDSRMSYYRDKHTHTHKAESVS